MRKYIVIALVLLAAGVGVSFYLIPSKSEVAAAKAQSPAATAVDVSKVDVAAEYAKGNRSLPVVSALADQKTTTKDLAGAVALLEEFVKANPADGAGHKKLAELYQLAGNQAGYAQELDALAKAAPTEANLRMLSDTYNANKEYVKQVEVLKKLVEVTKGANAQSYVDLATIQVVVGDSDGALKTVEELKAKHKDFSSYPMTRIMVNVLADKGKTEEAFEAAKGWIDQTNAPVPTTAIPAPGAAPAPVAAAVTTGDKPKELADLINILHYSGHADKAVALAEPYTAMLANSPELVLAYVNAHITAGKTDTAYGVLKQLDDANQMTAALYPPYLDLTFKRDDIVGAAAIAGKLDVATFNEEQALNTFEITRANNASTVLETLTQRFGDAAVLKDKPVLTAVIAILTGDKAQDTKIETALNLQLTSTQRIRLAESCARAKKTACFEAMVKQYPALEQMPASQVAEYAQLHIIASRAGDVVEPVGKLALAQNAPAQTITSYYRLAAAAGREDIMSPWLQANANNVPTAQLQELFYLANDRHHGTVANDIAERLYARDPSPMNRDIMVASYLSAGKYAKALPLLREQVKEPGASDALYLSSLNKLARTDKSARGELAEYAQEALKTGHSDAKAQLNYAYILINNGHKDAVLPYAKANAASQGGEWKKLYAQLTEKPKAGNTVKLTREQMVAMAASPSVGREQRRQLAFNLLHDGFKSDAVAIFKDLAKDKGPESQEVKDLMYLWGGKLKGEELAWIKTRAASANAYDKQRWGEIVMNAADDQSLLAFVSAVPDSLYNRDLRKKYFRVLAATGNRQHYETAMRDWVAQTTDVSALLDYASIGQNTGFKEAAASGYNRVLVLDPNNGKALSQLAALDYSKGKFNAADQKLNQLIYTQNQKPDAEVNSAEAHFYKAQLLRRQGKKEEAKAEFTYVVELTSKTGATTPDALSRVYTSQFHLGQHAAAKAGFEQLLEQYPDEKSILADYMSALIEYNYLEDATRIANQYDKNSPYYRKGASLAGNSKNTASVEQFSGGREMRINFTGATEQQPPVDLARAKKLGWVEHAELGYDSLSISAKHGYVVKFVPTANEQFEVVAAPQPNYAPQVEEKRQQDLRLQLLYARIEQQSGQADKAAKRLAALEYYYPNDPQLLAYKASVASTRGDNDQALALLKRAQSIAPENEDLSLQVQNIRRIETGKSYAKLDHEYRALGDNQEHITTLTAVAATGRTEFGITGQNNFLSTDQTRRGRDGAIGDYDVTRQRGEVFVAQNFDGGTRAQASLYGNNKSVGVGGDVAFKSPIGRVDILGEYQRPYWDFVEAVYEHTTRDRIGVKDFAELRPGTTLGIEASLNNYNTDVKDDVARSTLVRANLVQQIQPETTTQPYLGVGYGFDGEYLSGKPKSALDGSNNAYYLLPVRTREVHALTGIYRNDLSAQTHALLIGGVAYDRINGGVSPLAEGRIDHDLDMKWQVGARARYAQETNNTDNHELDLGADVLYKF